MTPLPAFTELSRSGESLTLSLDVSADSSVLEGHFPGTPILPAVAQIDWAIRLGREHFAPLPAHVRTLRSLKFLRVIQPPLRLTLDLERAPDGRSISFAYAHQGAACSQGRIEFSDDAAGPDRSLL